MDVGCYCISGSRLLGGEPEAVFGRAYVGPTGTDWAFAGSLRFPGDVLALFDCATCLPEPRRAGGDRLGGLALPRRSLALPEPGDRAAPRRRCRADRAWRRPIRTSSSSRISAARSAHGTAPLLGRDDAVAQAARDRRAAPLGRRRPRRVALGALGARGRRSSTSRRWLSRAWLGDRGHQRGASRAASAAMIAACSWQISSRSGTPRPRVRRAMRAS